MASPITQKPRAEPQAIFNDEKTDPGSSTPTLYDENEAVNRTDPGDTVAKDATDTYVTGWKLVSLMISITVAAFLMLLDMSIITTVCLISKWP